MSPNPAHRSAIVALLLLLSAAAHAQDRLGYDSAADPFEQLEAAQATAEREAKRVLVIAGGEWCIWCHYLDAFLSRNADVGGPFKETFVVVKAYFAREGDNEAFFASLPRAAGYPHFWVLAADGSLLASQNTLPLEDGGKSYDKARFLAFIDEWKAMKPL
ncbi:MAG TPA: thioredoxin family protein [Gammaproteobacteria bacterium]|jgi:hypothetical protein